MPVKEGQDKPFSLTSAIFSRFEGFDLNEEPPKDEMEQLQKTVENLKTQQDIVRQNMISMAKQQADYVQARAQEEIRQLQNYPEPENSDRATLEAKSKIDAIRNAHRANLLARLSTPPKPGSSPEDFLFNMRQLNSNSITDTTPPEDEPIPETSTTRTADTIKDEVAKKLQEIITLTTCELEGYDIHSKIVLERYKTALEKKGAVGGKETGEISPQKVT
ncbi:hypothetical protein GLAREA_05562 [Glarea lozoyensis ATCC 20868]|uniref:Uncharacterized protein n=1 Tax=Glarea lozoyensis (strain ATCC 20868 / MF5171) TaxID=1116229 RepID=S3DGG5_GLAL2|nr:uncharacterized protein GLAREA_05562 [Glarea lozoyensis ATCC 20868]EPE36224.1 hypothetical protein GLAREA_05562 [Glarea lozoyensis ATCC 20868]